jgi:hypothetical protein
MDKSEAILALGNALIMLETVETKGEKNLNALLASMQQVRKVYKAMKEEKTDEKRDDA